MQIKYELKKKSDRIKTNPEAGVIFKQYSIRFKLQINGYLEYTDMNHMGSCAQRLDVYKKKYTNKLQYNVKHEKKIGAIITF